MKKILFGMMAAAVLATSCAKELQDVATGDATVTFTVGTPEIATRAYSDGTTATELQYAVYDAAGNYLADLTGTQGINISTTVELKLTTGNTYTVAFWADSQAAPYTVDFANKSVSVDYTGVKSNDENLDAFYAWYTFTVTGAQTETVELKRPFAQLNIGTADYEASEKAGYVPTASTVTVKNVYSTLNFATGAVSGETAVTFEENAISKTETFPVTGYDYLAMNYLLVATDKALVEVEFTYTDGSNAKTRTVGSVPVQRNYRTNIYGNILTSDVNLNVVIKPEYNEPAHELDALQKAALNGGVVTLNEDVVLTTPLEVYGEMTINLNGKTISSPSSYAIENYSKLTISGEGNMEGLGGIRSHGGSLTINGGNYTCSSNWSTGTYNHILKAVDTEVVINGGNFDATVGGTNNAMINVSENSIITINGGTFKNVNGVIPQFAPYMFTYEKNGKLIINGGDFYGGWRFNGETATTDIKGGTFAVSYDGQSFHAASTHVLTIYGGVFSLENGAKLNPAKHIAAGMKAVEKDGRYYVVANDTELVSTSAQFSDALAEGKNVLLHSDVNITKIDLTAVSNDIVIDANGNTITTASNYGIEVTAGKNITLKNAEVVITVNGDYINYAAGFKIANGDYAGQTIKLENCEIRMANTDWAYAINMPANVKNLNLVIDKCVLEGAIALQCWGDNNTITVTDSELICNYTTSALYTSYCVALQGDGTNNSENNTLAISNCEFAYSGVDNFNSEILSAYAHRHTNTNTITIKDCTYVGVTAY